MGEIVKPFRLRLGPRHRSVKTLLCFDSGSPTSFLARSAAERIGHLMELGEPKNFGGLGNGHFVSQFLCHAEVRIITYWCAWSFYVVDDVVFHDRFDGLIGHGFMQNYGVELIPRKRALRYDRRALALSQIVL